MKTNYVTIESLYRAFEHRNFEPMKFWEIACFIDANKKEDNSNYIVAGLLDLARSNENKLLHYLWDGRYVLDEKVVEKQELGKRE